MDDIFIRNRITQLRINKGVSEYKMSTEMGHSKSYVQSITSGRALPSLSEFLYICEYLKVTPALFFSEEVEHPVLVGQIMNGIKKLNEKDLALILDLVIRMSN